MMNNMNNFGMNPMGFNPLFMNNMGMIGINNQPNLMDETAIRIRNIIQPYENKIKELEEIIRQQNFEIAVLNEKLITTSLNAQNIINQKDLQIADLNKKLVPNIIQNQNFPNFQNAPIKQEENCISVVIQSNIKNIKCFKNQKASTIEDILNLKRINLTFNYKPISFNKTIEENGIYDGCIINLTNQVYNIDFNHGGNHWCVPLDGECPLKIAIISFCEKCGNPKLYGKALKKKIQFFYRESLNILADTPIKNIFGACFNPRVTVLQ